MSMLNCSVDQSSLTFSSSSTSFAGSPVQQTSCWAYWQNCYYPQVIYPSYPVYIRERALDKGKKAYEIIKILRDKKIVKLEKVSDFINIMDELIKIL